MRKRSGSYPRLGVDVGGAGVVSHAGGVLLTAAIGRVGLDQALSQALAPWRKPHAVHDPAKVVLDLAVTLALGGDCLADIALLRSAPGVFGPVASDPTVSRTIDALAVDAPAALAAIDTARAAARARAWQLAGPHAPDHDVDAARPAGHRCGRDAGDGAQREGAGGADVQARVRLPSPLGVRRPRRGGHR